MTGILDSNGLTEQVIEKHRRFLDTFNHEFSELESKLNSIKQQSEAIKKEIDSAESRVAVLAEKYHLLFYQAKKHREELFSAALEKMRKSKASGAQDVMRLGGRLEEFEKKLQGSKRLGDEERMIVEMSKLLYGFESAAGKAGISIACKGVMDKLNEAYSSHKELLSLQDKPKEHAVSAKEFDRQKGELEGRYNWLKHRIESHNNALAYWEKYSGGVKVG